jgi:hypothetical protein
MQPRLNPADFSRIPAFDRMAWQRLLSERGQGQRQLSEPCDRSLAGHWPLFGGHEVGIGFSGTYDGEGAEGEATALAGKRSIRFKAVLRKLVEIES